MQNNSLLYFKNLRNCHPAVGYYFDSKIMARQSGYIKRDFSLSEKQIYSLVTALVANNFNFNSLPQLLLDLNIKLTDIRLFCSTFVGQIFSPLYAFLKNGKVDVYESIEYFGGNRAKFLDLANEYNVEWDLKSRELLIESTSDLIESIDVDDEADNCISILSTTIGEFLKSESTITLDKLNWLLIFILQKKINFKDEALKALSQNNVVFISSSLIIDNKPCKATIENCIKDFVKSVGGGKITSLEFTQYLTTGKNTSKLSKIERDLLRRLLQFYINLRFFPESISGTGQEVWRIMPIESTINEKEFLMELNKTPLAVAKGNEPINKKSEPRPLQNTTPEQNKHLAELMLEANKYPVGSLERRAVESAIAAATAGKEEIKRVQS